MKIPFRFIFILVAVLVTQKVSSADESLVIIVNADNPVTQMTPEQVADLYRKHKREWPNGIQARFFERADPAPERKTFLRTILRESGRGIDSFWIMQKWTDGVRAPMQVDSDGKLETLVSRFPGGIGYVSSSFRLNERVKKVEIIGTP